jgi:hypothetical protein
MKHRVKDVIVVAPGIRDPSLYREGQALSRNDYGS